MRFLLSRMLRTTALFLGLSLLSFLLLDLAPGDYFDEMRTDPRISPETVSGLRARYGLDRPIWVRYGAWLASVAGGDWGFSFAYATPVAPLLWRRGLNTLLLTVTALTLAWALALPAGLYWATTKSRPLRVLFCTGTSAFLSLPEVLLALALLLLAVETGAFPAGGMRSLSSVGGAPPGDLLWHMALPVLALVLPAASILIRHVRASVAEIVSQPFLLNARALGLTGPRYVLHYVLRPASAPLITLLGLSIAGLLSASLVVEVVMGWPGLGPLLLDAILARDVYVVIGGVLGSAALLVVGTTLADALLHLSDPRIAARQGP